MRLILPVTVLLLVPAGAQEVVDRMAAVVNRRVILESELEQTARVEELLQGKPPGYAKPGSPEIEAVLDRMIDRALLEQQIALTAPLDPTADEVKERVTEIREKIAGAGGDEGWKSLLATYGLTVEDVEFNVVSEFRVLRFIDLHFRGLVRVDRTDIQTYYLETFLPQLRLRGAAVPPLAEVSDRIEKILIEQRMDEMLNDWLQTLRAQAHIEKFMAPGSSLTHGENR